MVKVVAHSCETNTSIIEVLNDASLQLLEIKEENAIYKILASAISTILPGAYCTVSKLQPDKKNFRIVQMHGVDQFLKSAKRILGKDPFDLDFPYVKLAEAHTPAFESRSLYHFKEGLYGIAAGAIPKITCKAIEKLGGISDIYTTCFYMDGTYFGGLTLLIPKRVMKSGILTKEALLAIETLSNLATVLIHKLQANDELTTSRKELETTMSRSNLMLQNLTDIAWRANGDGSNVEDLNNSFERIYGYSAEKFIENPNLWMELAHPDDRPIVAKLNEELFQNGNVSAEYRVVRPDGKITWLHDRVSIIYDENKVPIMMGGIAKDITEQKGMQLMHQELIASKDKLFSIIAHDLKSPFNSIIGFTDILVHESKTISEEDRDLYINLLHDSAVSTYKLLENLLEWSRLHLSNYEINQESISPKFNIDDCIELYRAMAENKKITVINQVSHDIKVRVDDHSINTVLRNLLNNALKYTPEGGHITFTSTNNQNHVEISVHDTGGGIKPIILNKLFHVGENTTTLGTKLEKGTGLGLVLCKELLEKNNGYIRVESVLGQGSTFTLGLPLQSI